MLMCYRSVWVSNLFSFPKDRMEMKWLSEVAPVFVECHEHIVFLSSALDRGNWLSSNPARFTFEKERRYRLSGTPQRPRRRARPEFLNLWFATQRLVVKVFWVDCETKLWMYLLLTRITSTSVWKAIFMVTIISCSHTVAMSARLSCYIKWHRQLTTRVASLSAKNYRISRTKEYRFFVEVAARVGMFSYFEE
jgi:hypothetical protein